MDSLSLELVVSPSVGENNIPTRHAWAQATVNGRPLGTAGAPLDFYSVISHRKLSGPMDLLTCSCGVAGCAGFHSDVVQTWEGESVTWRLDARDYAEELPDAKVDPQDSGLLVLTLSAKALEEAIDGLYAQFRDALAAGPLIVVPGRVDAPITSMDELEEAFIAQREWFLENQASEARELALFGRYADAVVRARFPSGLVKEAGLRLLLMCILGDEAHQKGVESQLASTEYAHDQVRQHWLKLLDDNPEAALQSIALRANDALSSVFWVVERPSVGTPVSPLPWSDATFELITSAGK